MFCSFVVCVYNWCLECFCVLLVVVLLGGKFVSCFVFLVVRCCFACFEFVVWLCSCCYDCVGGVVWYLLRCLIDLFVICLFIWI